MRYRRGGLLVAIIVAVCGTIVAGRYAGEFLARRDRLVDADVAIVLSGEPLMRALAARDLGQG